MVGRGEECVVYMCVCVGMYAVYMGVYVVLWGNMWYICGVHKCGTCVWYICACEVVYLCVYIDMSVCVYIYRKREIYSKQRTCHQSLSNINVHESPRVF